MVWCTGETLRESEDFGATGCQELWCNKGNKAMCCWLWRQFPLSSCISWAYVILLPHGRWHSNVVKAVIVLKLVLCPTGLLMETGWKPGEGLGLHSYKHPIEELRCASLA